jgi:hypothetical protein
MSGGITMVPGLRPIVSHTNAVTPAATQEPLTQQRRAATTTPVAVWPRQPNPGGSESIVTHGRHRDRRQQIIRRRLG